MLSFLFPKMKQLLLERAKVMLTGIAVAALLALFTASCTTMRKDCHGNKHQKLSNGIHLMISLPAIR